LLTIAAGTHAITALYSGDSNYQASVSASASFTISAATVVSAVTVAINPATVVQGTAVTVVASITPSTPAPTGTAQVVLDGTLYGPSIVLTGTTTNLPLLTNTLQAGPHIVQVTYSGDSNHQSVVSPQETLSVLNTVGTFTLSPSTVSTTATQGNASKPVTLTVNPLGGFHSTITFACTGGLPSGATCLFTPSTLLPSGAASETTVLTISPAATALPSARAAHNLSPGVGAAFAGLLLIFAPRRARRWSVFSLLLALTTLGVLNGCGSGGVDPNGASPSSLSAGSYVVAVTAIGGSSIQGTTVNLPIN
jgi:hypothetical protein